MHQAASKTNDVAVFMGFLVLHLASHRAATIGGCCPIDSIRYLCVGLCGNQHSVNDVDDTVISINIWC
jgi:hypothetical protein